MRYSQLFTKTSKTVSEETESINAQMLTRAGFIRQEIAGVYTYLPLGLRVLNKIETIVREEMNRVSVEVLLPSLMSQASWRTTGRIDSVDVLMEVRGANDASRLHNDATYILGPSHEEVITPLAKSFCTSYKDFPFSAYQVQSKFRNEPRAKSGLLRGREFRMKDMYSFHTSQADLMEFYESMKAVYLRVYDRVGIGADTFVSFASGGDFTDNYSHEFQTLLPSGEDTLYLDRQNQIAYNKEIATPEDAKKLGVDFESLEPVKASEVGNIFPLDTKFSKAFDYLFVNDENQRNDVWMGCYGLGTSRLMGVIAEKFADDKGLVWPAAVAPYQYHLIALGDAAQAAAAGLVDQLGTDNVLFDDRTESSAGQKFADAELIGCPIRLVISDKTLERDAIEVVSRSGRFDQQEVSLSEENVAERLEELSA